MVWEILIPAIAAGLSLLAIGLESFTHDREKAKGLEFALRRKQMEIKKYQKEKNTKAMMAAQKELMSLTAQNFRLRSKTMLISFPMFIIIFWLFSGMLNVAPLYAGQSSQVGIDMRNLAQEPQKVDIEVASSDIQVTGENKRILDLDDKGDQGDRQQVWWNVTAPEGQRQYTLKVNSGNSTDEATYALNFAAPGSLSAGFSPGATAELLDKSLSITPIYKAVEVNLGVITLPWFWYYLISYFIMSAALSPLKNRVLWGHHKGIKHLEKLDRENKETKSQ